MPIELLYLAAVFAVAIIGFSLLKRLPGVQAAIVSIRKKDGNTVTERVDFPKGEPENPLSETEFRERFDALMEYGHQKCTDEIYRLVYENGRVRELTELL